jgi:hypothetical protein
MAMSARSDANWFVCDGCGHLVLPPESNVQMHLRRPYRTHRQGGADIYFVGKGKPLHPTTGEAAEFRDYISGEHVRDLTKAA